MLTPPRSGPGRHTVDRLRLLVEIDDSAAPERLALRLHGELDLSTVENFAAVVHGASTGRGEADLDLTDLTFCDVVGATAIERAQRELLAGGCRLSLVGVVDSLRLLTRVDGLFPTLRTPVPVDGSETSG